MPFDGRWFYGDALFVIDPWVYLVLGGILFLTYSRKRLSLARWVAFWSLASFVVLANPALVPFPARITLALRLDRARDGARARIHGVAARGGDGARGGGRAESSSRSTQSAKLTASRRGACASPRGARGRRYRAVEASDGGACGGQPVRRRRRCGQRPTRTTRADGIGSRGRRSSSTPKLCRGRRGAVFDAAARAEEARDFLTWARFPFVEVEPAEGGALDRAILGRSLSRQGGWNGPTVRLDRDPRGAASE